MTTIVRHPNRHIDARSAALQALLRWYPTATTRMVERVRAMYPNYPLIIGGSPQPALRGAPTPDDGGSNARACA